MKTCPTCNMTVDNNDCCPICKTSLLYEPFAHTDEEHILFNKYYMIYLLKTLWFSGICFLFCTVRIAGWHKELDFLCFPIIFLSSLSLFLGFTQRRTFDGLAQLFYTESYSRALRVFVKYLSASASVFLAVIPILVA